MFLRAFRPGPYPKQCSPRLPVQPRLAGGGHERLGYFCTGSSVRHLICEVFFFPPDYVAICDSKTPCRPAGERVSWCLETSPPSLPFPKTGRGRVSVPNSFVSIFIFYILSYCLSKTMGCRSRCLVSSTRVQKLVEVAQYSNDLLMNLWGRKWSPYPIPQPF